MNKTQILYKWVIIIIVTVGIFCRVQITNAALPEGFDFTVPADTLYMSGELLVRFVPKTGGKQRSLAERNQILSSLGGGVIKRNFKIVPGLTLVKLPTGLTVKDALKTFNKTDGILHAQPNYLLKALSTFPNEQDLGYFNEQWGLHNTGLTGGTSDADIDAPEAWDIHTGSSDIVVAVIDTGVDYTHPDLAANMWINPGEDHYPFGVVGPEDFDGINDDGNYDSSGTPLIDDIYGYDFCTYGGKERDSDPNDDSFDGHGTHVAGIIGAVGDNNEGVVGVCWNVKIMALKFLNANSDGWSSDAIECIEYAVGMGTNILNNSWGGGPYDPDLETAIENAGAKGVLFVAAAGNEGNDNDTNPDYPSGYDCNNIISVMATDSDDNRSIWDPFFEDDDSSNYGATSVDLAAPGSGILSCQPGGGYQYMNGTSMAAPYVAGAAALVWSANPALSHKTVKWIILDTVDVVFDDPNLPKYCVTDGRLNLYNAVFKAGVLPLSKIDDVNNGSSVVPGYDITYTISYGNPFTDLNDPNYIGDINNVVITDYLPDEVDYPDPFDPGYDMLNRTYTWNIGTLSPGEANSVTLTVRVNQLAEPLGKITNICVIDANQIRPTTAIETTDVNVWNPGVIYVDKNATVGSNTGMSWEDAYTNLQTALARAGGGGSQIWVAAGTYKPTTDPLDYTATFALVDGVAVYGGFAGTETSRSRRNWITNKTVLTGDIMDDNGSDVDYVVSGLDVNETTVIDGFTIMKGFYAGVYLNDSSPTIKHNIISENKSKGIDCDNSSPRIVDCNVEDNGSYGIYYSGTFDSNITKCIIKDNGNDGIYNNNSSSATNIINCIIEGNSGDGIYSYSSSSAVIANNIIGGNASYGINGIYDSSTEIKNNWIYNNGYGILIDSYLATVNIRNNTIANNTYYGIRSYSPQEVSITNCIIWGSSPLFTTGYSVTYSCIQDGYIGAGNISNNPGFMNPDDPNDYHLGPDSPCIDAGNTGLITDSNEADIDGEDRVMDGDANGTVIVDMGADEYYWSSADFNRDGFVNFIDYTQLASAWQATPADNDYNDIYDLEDNNFIDYGDLALFCEDWPWAAGWTKTFAAGTDSGLGGAGLYSSSSLSSAASLSSEPQPVDIEKLIKWLDGIWFSGEIKEVITEVQYLEFRKSIEESFK